jgi:glycosyltransferase involved in cell wall biosynthesis
MSCGNEEDFRKQPANPMTAPRIAILIAVYNRLDYLPETIAAINEQTFRDFVIVAVDDASSDGSFEFLEAAARAEPRRWLIARNRKNLGGTANMNRCVALQREHFPDVDYLVKIDSDDIISPDLLRIGVGVMDADPDTVLCHFRTYFSKGGDVWESGAGEFNARLAAHSWSRVSSHRMTSAEALHMFIRLDNFVASSSGAFVRRSALESLKWPWRDETMVLEDYELWTRLVTRGAVRFVADTPIHLRVAPNSMLRSEPAESRVREACRIAERAYWRNWRVLGPRRCVTLLPVVIVKALRARGISFGRG